MAFEPNIAPYVTGSIGTPQIVDSGDLPASIIRTSDSWKIKLDWSTNGLLVPLVNPAAQWQITAYLESFGPHPDVTLPVATEAFGAPANAHNFSKTLNIAAGAVGPGAYRLVVVVTLTSGGLPMPIAAFTEGPMLTFFVAS
jgi:hypothetical protein